MTLYEWISTGVLIVFAAGTFQIVNQLKEVIKWLTQIWELLDEERRK